MDLNIPQHVILTDKPCSTLMKFCIVVVSKTSKETFNGTFFCDWGDKILIPIIYKFVIKQSHVYILMIFYYLVYTVNGCDVNVACICFSRNQKCSKVLKKWSNPGNYTGQ